MNDVLPTTFNHLNNTAAALINSAASAVAATTQPNANAEGGGIHLLQCLLRAVREIQTAFGGARKELATEANARVAKLCDLWDSVLCHGLRTPPASTHASALLQNVAERVAEAVRGASSGSGSIASSSSAQPTFWSFARPHLTAHERERFSTMQHVCSDHGRGRALLRAALNERSLERYVLVWLNAPQLEDAYESWAVMRDPEAINLLPSMAAGLGTILFAVLVDNGALNGRISVVSGGVVGSRAEPIIVAPPPTRVVKAVPARRRHLVSFGEDAEEAVDQPLAGSPKTLSSMCLRQDVTTGGGGGNKSANTDLPAATCRPFDAVFGLQPELPSEIVKFEAHRTAGNEVLTPTEDAMPASEPANNNAHQPVYELVSEYDELANYLQTELAQTMIGSNVNSNTSASSVSEHEDEKSMTSSSVHSSNDPHRQTIEGGDAGLRVEQLEVRLRHMTDRCELLENQVAELNLENHRLRGLCDAPGQYAFFGLSIPRVYLDSSGRKPYYVYEVRIAATTEAASTLSDAARRVQWTVLRRYTDFYELHRKYRRDSAAVEALKFPPKKHFGNMDTKFVELRRQRLQVYIRHFFSVVPESRLCVTRAQLELMLPFFRQ